MKWWEYPLVIAVGIGVVTAWMVFIIMLVRAAHA